VEVDDSGAGAERVEKKSGAALQNMQRNSSGTTNQPGEARTAAVFGFDVAIDNSRSSLRNDLVRGKNEVV